MRSIRPPSAILVHRPTSLHENYGTDNRSSRRTSSLSPGQDGIDQLWYARTDVGTACRPGRAHRTLLPGPVWCAAGARHGDDGLLASSVPLELRRRLRGPSRAIIARSISMGIRLTAFCRPKRVSARPGFDDIASSAAQEAPRAKVNLPRDDVNKILLEEAEDKGRDRAAEGRIRNSMRQREPRLRAHQPEGEAEAGDRRAGGTGPEQGGGRTGSGWICGGHGQAVEGRTPQAHAEPEDRPGEGRSPWTRGPGGPSGRVDESRRTS